jgi:hypothetical protein
MRSVLVLLGRAVIPDSGTLLSQLGTRRGEPNVSDSSDRIFEYSFLGFAVSPLPGSEASMVGNNTDG